MQFSLLGLKRSDVSVCFCIAGYAVLFLVFRKLFEWMPTIEFRRTGKIDGEMWHFFLALCLLVLSVIANVVAVSVLYDSGIKKLRVRHFSVVTLAQMTLAVMTSYVGSDGYIVGWFWVCSIIMAICLFIAWDSRRGG